MASEAKIPFFLINRYLRRGNKWKLFLTIGLMAIAFINLIFITSLFNGIIEMANNQIIDTYTANIFIKPKENKDFIEKIDEKVSIIEGTNNVEAVSSQNIVPASLEHKGIKGNWAILAINPLKESKVTNVSKKIIEGSYLNENDENGIIIGRQIAGGKDVEMEAFSFKGAKVGDKVKLVFNNNTLKEFTIRGIFYTKFIDTDQKAFITQKSLEKIVPGVFDNKANDIIIKTKKGQENVIITNLKARGIDESFYTWKDMAGLMKTVTESFFSINVLLSGVGVAIAAFTIFIVIYIDINNKRKQIGILRAIGIKPYLINALYVMQTVVYSCFGVILGAAIFFCIIMPYFNAHPFQLPIGDAKLVVNYADFIIRMEVIIFTAILSGLIPAILVTRMKILDAIWGKQ